MQKFSSFIILTFIYSSTCVWRFSAHHQELNDCSDSLSFYLRIVVIVVLCSWSGRPAELRERLVTMNILISRLVLLCRYQHFGGHF